MCFMDTLANCCGLMDPYGDMPMAGGMEASAEIDIMESDGNIHVSVVKTPPRDGKIRLPEVLAAIMGSQMGLECAADQAKCKPEECPDKQDDSGKMDDCKPPSLPEDAKHGDKSGKSDPYPAHNKDASGRVDDKDPGRKEFQRS